MLSAMWPLAPPRWLSLPGFSLPAKAAYTVTLLQQGPDVVANRQGINRLDRTDFSLA